MLRATHTDAGPSVLWFTGSYSRPGPRKHTQTLPTACHRSRTPNCSSHLHQALTSPDQECAPYNCSTTAPATCTTSPDQESKSAPVRPLHVSSLLLCTLCPQSAVRSSMRCSRVGPGTNFRNSFWKFEGLERCGNWGNSGNLGVWRGVETGNSGNLALKTPDFQSSGNLTLSQRKSVP